MVSIQLKFSGKNSNLEVFQEHVWKHFDSFVVNQIEIIFAQYNIKEPLIDKIICKQLIFRFIRLYRRIMSHSDDSQVITTKEKSGILDELLDKTM